MSEKKISVSLIPGADTPEGAARLQKELEARNDIDFRAFQMLRDLAEEGLFNSRVLTKLYRDNGESKEDAKEFAQERAEEISQILRDRRMADHYVLAAAAGHPDPRKD